MHIDEGRLDSDRTGRSAQLRLFARLWQGGYYSGDPLEPTGLTEYLGLGYISVLHAVYQVCIRPNVTPNTYALEIGPGRGAWTKTMLHAREIWCLDALSAEHNRFWEYVGKGHANHVTYIQVSDFSCSPLPDNYFDYLFSFGTFCHITREDQFEYYRRLYGKLKPGAVCFIMFSDFDKYNRAVEDWAKSQVLRLRPFHLRPFLKWMWYQVRPPSRLDSNDTTPSPGKFYHVGIQETVQMLSQCGYRVLSGDIGLLTRDPIIHFLKP